VSYVRSFAPWIAFAVIPSGQWKWAALFALVVSVANIVQKTKGGLPLDAQILDVGTAVYFAALTALAFADPGTSLHTYIPAMASGAVGLIALGSLVIRKPFTLGLARLSMPREVWDNPLFLRTNMIITAVWTASFAICCVALIGLAHSSVGERSIVQTAGFAVPLVFTMKYVDHVRSKAPRVLHDISTRPPPLLHRTLLR
jgi:hypothetical protein